MPRSSRFVLLLAAIVAALLIGAGGKWPLETARGYGYDGETRALSSTQVEPGVTGPEQDFQQRSAHATALRHAYGDRSQLARASARPGGYRLGAALLKGLTRPAG